MLRSHTTAVEPVTKMPPQVSPRLAPRPSRIRQWIGNRSGEWGMTGSIWDRLNISAQSGDKQPAEERVRNWEEVYQGLDLHRARIEAARCIHCPSAPCMEACPAHNDVPRALLFLENGDPIGAAQVFRETSNLPEM